MTDTTGVPRIRAAHSEPEPEPAPAAPPGRNRRPVLIAVGALVLLLGAVVAVAVLGPGGGGRATSTTGGSTSASVSSAAARPSTPVDLARLTLQEQADALVRGDQAAFLSAVDPSAAEARDFFRKRFQVLRSLHVSQYAYEFENFPRAPAGTATFTGQVLSAYCFSLTSCPKIVGSATNQLGAPKISESMTFRLVDGRYVIASVVGGAKPTPWESGDLEVAQGQRVTVATVPGATARLPEAVAAADRAAAVADRFAAMFDNPQGRYRIYLADEPHWAEWFGGRSDPDVSGYAIALNDVQTDVVVRMSANASAAELANTIQHELGHVVTVGSLSPDGKFVLANFDKWLKEGIAEYIAYAPRTASASARVAGVRALVKGPNSPRSIEGVGDDDSAFYGYAHFTLDCFAQLYGQDKMVKFAKLVLRQQRSHDDAAKEAFGKPFDTVDADCVAWIRKQL